jgi:hypothetical protein
MRQADPSEGATGLIYQRVKIGLAGASPGLFSLAIMENDAQCESCSAFYPAHSMSQRDPIVSTCSFHWPISRCKDQDLPLFRDCDFRFRLCARLLLDHDEFTAFVVHPWTAKEASHL